MIVKLHYQLPIISFVANKFSLKMFFEMKFVFAFAIVLCFMKSDINGQIV